MKQTTNTTTSGTWSSFQTFAIAGICLVIGISGGWLIRKARSGQTTAETTPIAPNTPVGNTPLAIPSQSPVAENPEILAAPLLERLKTNPNDAPLLADIGNIYYDSKDYPIAINYYERALKTEPSNTSVRTDMATAYWYTGNADMAISEFTKALSFEPTKANALFNLGIVKLQGKKDAAGAVAAWEKLLATNPAYEGRDKVRQMINEAKASAGIK